MATIMSLSNEVIIVILKNVSIKDIKNFTSTCKKFRQISWDNKLWMKKLYQNWPSTRKIYDSMTSNDLFKLDFKEQVKEAVKHRKEMWDLIAQISKINLDNTYKKNIISNFLCTTVHSINNYIAIDELRRIISQSPWISGCNLTHRYYSCHILRLVKYYHIRHKLLQFRCKLKRQQILEQMITLLIQWFNVKTDFSDDISYSHIKASLDHIAEKVLQALKEQHPSHPIFTMCDTFYDYCKNNNVSPTYWNHEETLKILIVLEKIVFSPSYFHKLDQLWIKSHKNESEIVVSRGLQSIFFLTIYQGVMRRLGIYSIVITENMLQIFLKPTDITKRPEYIGIQLKNGQFCLENVIKRDNRDRNHLLIKPTLIEYLKIREKNLNIQDEGQLLILWHIMEGKHADVTDLMKWESNVNIRKSEPQKRSAELKFVIGTIVTHKYINKNKTSTHHGVIVGWHHYFSFDSIFGIFKTLPNNYSKILTCKNIENCTDPKCLVHKPYYIIFCDNNVYCYERQEKISICSSTKWIHHDEIGRYFSKYEHTYYVPNEMLARDYPYDVAIINKMMRNQ
ncbi:F-box only protein 21 [Formica fusca]